MKFILGIKPTVLTGYGTTREAKERFRSSIRGCFTYSSKFGSAWTNTYGANATSVYGFNIEVFKRRKHRGPNKHYVIYRYTFPVAMFDLLNVEIRQGSRTFKIMPKKK